MGVVAPGEKKICSTKLPQLQHQLHAFQHFKISATPVGSKTYVVMLAYIPVPRLPDDCTLVPKHVRVNMSNCVSNRAYSSRNTIVAQCKNCHLELVTRLISNL